MNKQILLVMLLFTTSAAHAQDAQTLAKQKACLGCHSIQHQGISVPPAYNRIADKYRDRPDAVDYLSDKIQNGGRDVWGGHMPAFPNLTRAEVDLLARWILSIR